MKPLFVTSVSDYSGKNLLLTGLGRKMQADGYRINFFKPLGNRPIRYQRTLTDADVAFFREVFSLKKQTGPACSVLLTEDLLERILSGGWKTDLSVRINSILQKMSAKDDIVLIKGLSRFYRGSILGVSELSLIKEFNWPTVAVGRLTTTGETIDSFLGGKQALGNLLIGVIFNYVPPAKINYLKKKVVPFLKKYKIDVLGIIPRSTSLESVSVGEIKEALGADLICGQEQTGQTIERFCPGTMNVESALKYFRKEKCMAVVTEGDRADIQLAALESNTRCLILTSRLYPDDIILSRAQEHNVPVLVVRDDTLKTLGKLEKLANHIGLDTFSKVKEAEKIIRTSVNIRAIYRKLGLK